MKTSLILIVFFILLNDSFEFENIRSLEENIELNNTDIRIYNNTLVIECNDSYSLINYTNETNTFLNFNNYDVNKSLSCNFFAYDQNNDNYSEFYKIECPINQTIKSSFSKSQLYLPKQNKTLDIVIFGKSVTYNYNILKFLSFADFKTNNNISTLKAYFSKTSNYTSKKNLFFGVQLYNNSHNDWVIAKGIETNKNINGTLVYNITINHEKNDTVDIISNNDYCLTDDESGHITYCDGAKGDNIDMKVEYQIITFYNSKILNPNDKNIKIQGDLSDKINLASNSNSFYLKDTRENYFNCSLSVNDTKYNMICNLGKLTNSNFLYAKANITNIIANVSDLRFLEEGKGILALINGEEKDLEADYIPTPIRPRTNSSGGLSGGAIAGIVIACVAAIAAGIVTAICLTKKPPTPEKHVGVSNSTDNINQN